VAVRGAGIPVVFLSGLWLDSPGESYDIEPGQEWTTVLNLLTEPATTIVYDRAGTARSDALPDVDRAGGARAAAADLYKLLAALDLAAPIVMVGQSLGAVVAERFARTWPSHTAGIVTVDGTPAQFHSIRRDPRLVEGRGGQIFNAREDGSPADLTPVFPAIPSLVLTSAVGTFLRVSPEAFSVPLAEVDVLWQRWQAEAAERLAAPQVVAHTSPHLMQRHAPALVARAVDAVVQAVRAGDRTVKLGCPDGLNQAGGRLVERKPR
jgi:pimeloyl-ACP methyl ester carboxylesterase